jgi:16S rRNA processing protein RimM
MKIQIGLVQKPFGIKGEVKVKPMTDYIEDRFKVGSSIELLLNEVRHNYVIESVRHHQGSLLVKFEGLDSLNDVEFYHRGIIQVDRNDLDDLEEDEFYFTDIIGFKLQVDGDYVGIVSEVMDLPAHPVLRVKTETDDILIPFVASFIETVDTDEDIIYVKGMDGLL